ncbi:MAG: NAD-dependent epimerase/dehydratase family protein [Mycobacteriales bacterium]
MTDSLTVAVTGPTGTFGYGLMPRLQADPRVTTVVGIARRPFDPSAEGWTKMEYRRGDVRDEDALREAFAGADVVVHLAFLIVGGRKDTTRAINVEGTLNAFRAAAAAGAERFVYASSVAAYGFHRDNPVGMTEDWPTRPADKLFYAQEKAELEELLHEEAAKHPEMALYLLRPPVVLGPHTVGGKAMLPGPLAPLNKHLQNGFRRLPVPVPAMVPDLPLQFIHEDDVGRALLQCVVAAGPPGAYNIAGDGVLSMVDVARELRVLPIPLPGRAVQRAARALSRLPLPSAGEWVEAFSHPAIMDTTRAKEVLGWEPQFTGLEALQDTLDS